ncbi:MAG: alpha-N-arabinofuranosidase [Planctomycetes bacterium]|nr:alpha-N-arabinofuranosidase [Planctomycetota bacterium]
MSVPAIAVFLLGLGVCGAGDGEALPRAVVEADPEIAVGPIRPFIYGHFLEHFHRIVYGGVFDPGSPLADENGFRKDVLEAMRRIRVPILRWPGGCFASAYHWRDGVGTPRLGVFDKAWRVEESNLFGTDEFVALCRAIGAQPYVCGNAGTGTPEEMSDWVEYANLDAGKWARLRVANGHAEPYGVRVWSIGNENWGGHEIGAKTAEEFARFVTETAKMMRRVDGGIELIAPSVPDRAWNEALLRSAGPYLDAIAIHIYSDPLWQNDHPAPYLSCARRSLEPEALIARTEDLLRALGEGRVGIAFDEWNLRGWHHPDFTSPVPDIAARDRNDINRTYTCADAVYAGAFLNACLRHADKVRMANFAPLVNARGAIFTHAKGMVLRPTYHVFDIYANHAGSTALDTMVASSTFRADGVEIPVVDAVMTRAEDGAYALAAVNRHDRLEAELEIKLPDGIVVTSERADLWSVRGAAPDAFNDIDHPDDVRAISKEVAWEPSRPTLRLPPHSVNVVRFTASRPRPPRPRAILANGGFEAFSCPSRPFGWRTMAWGGGFRASVSGEGARAGARCAMLESRDGADCAWIQHVRVEPRRRYRLTGWIRTEGVVAGSGRGAFLNIQEIQRPTTEIITGTRDWVRVELVFDAGDRDSLQVNALLGGWGRSRGACWFDEIRVEPVVR